jgi:hypothetical protein
MRATHLQQAQQLQQLRLQQQFCLPHQALTSTSRHPIASSQQQGPQDSQLWPSRDPETQLYNLQHHHQHSPYDQDQELLWLQQQRLSAHPKQLQTGGPSYMHSTQKQQQRLYSSKSSLAAALFVTPAQAQSMLVTYPDLGNYNHRFLHRKLQELSDVLGVPPQQLGPALVSAPKVLGYSLQEFERRLFGLTWIQPDSQQLTQVCTSSSTAELHTFSIRLWHASSTCSCGMLHLLVGFRACGDIKVPPQYPQC